MKKACFFIYILILSITANTQPTINVSAIPLGANICSIQETLYESQRKGIFLITVHADETTAATVAKQFVEQNGGSYISIQHENTRNIRFLLNNKKYVFDPNRIYTSQGRKATLKKLSTYSKEADEKISQLAYIFLQKLNKASLIIALHNNTNGKPLSIESYTKGGNEAANTKEVYVNKEMDADDFVYTTHQPIFDYLKSKKINVVLQHNKKAINDGSLSVYCGKKNIPYINIETELHHQKQQEEILQLLLPIMNEYGIK